MAKPKGTKKAISIPENKQKALELAKAAVEKEFGKGIVVTNQDHQFPEIERISSGCFGLDRALGGGYAKGRVVEIAGVESAGKCLPKYIYINTTDGLLTIEEILKLNNLEAFCAIKSINKKIGLINRYQEFENTKTITFNGKRKLKRIKTNIGNTITSTLNHPHLVMSKSGNWIWKKTKDITAGDYLVISRAKHDAINGKDIDKIEAYLYGTLIADANFEKNRIQITNDDPTIKTLIETYLSKLVDVPYRAYPNNENGSICYHYSNKENIANFYNRTGFSPGIAKDKNFPLFIRRLNNDSLKEVIAGYFDCECEINKNKRYIEITSTSKTLLEQTQLILLRFGIISILKPKSVKNYPDNEYFRLTLSGINVDLYKENIGFRSEIRKKQFSDLPHRTQVQTNIDHIPNVSLILEDLYNSFETNREIGRLFADYIGEHPKSNLTYTQLERILSIAPKNRITDRFEEIYFANYFYAKVKSIEDIESEPTFDFEMEDSHSFIANGIITHNTTIALHAVAEVQKQGGVPLFVDAEHALDLEYAENLGVDIDNMLLCQPSCGEEALNVVDTFARTCAVDLIIVDSVAALVPRTELEGNIGDASMGTQARLMSQAMRMLVGILYKTNTTVIFLNQIRMKIGVMFGNPETVTGGQALKFYASQRLDIRKIDNIKTTDEQTGVRSRVKVIKNKVGAPYRTAEFNIMFGTGIDWAMDILDSAVEANIINKSGAWFSFKGNQLGQGANNTALAIRDNKELTSELKQLLINKSKPLPVEVGDDSVTQDD